MVVVLRTDTGANGDVATPGVQPAVLRSAPGVVTPAVDGDSRAPAQNYGTLLGTSPQARRMPTGTRNPLLVQVQARSPAQAVQPPADAQAQQAAQVLVAMTRDGGAVQAHRVLVDLMGGGMTPQQLVAANPNLVRDLQATASARSHFDRPQMDALVRSVFNGGMRADDPRTVAAMINATTRKDVDVTDVMAQLGTVAPQQRAQILTHISSDRRDMVSDLIRQRGQREQLAARLTNVTTMIPAIDQLIRESYELQRSAAFNVIPEDWRELVTGRTEILATYLAAKARSGEPLDAEQLEGLSGVAMQLQLGLSVVQAQRSVGDYAGYAAVVLGTLAAWGIYAASRGRTNTAGMTGMFSRFAGGLLGSTLAGLGAVSVGIGTEAAGVWYDQMFNYARPGELGYYRAIERGANEGGTGALFGITGRQLRIPGLYSAGASAAGSGIGSAILNRIEDSARRSPPIRVRQGPNGTFLSY